MLIVQLDRLARNKCDIKHQLDFNRTSKHLDNYLVEVFSSQNLRKKLAIHLKFANVRRSP